MISNWQFLLVLMYLSFFKGVFKCFQGVAKVVYACKLVYAYLLVYSGCEGARCVQTKFRLGSDPT